jgi:hypothetical protein
MGTALSTQNLVANESATSFEHGENPSSNTHDGAPKDWKFWCIMFSLALSVLLTAVEFVSHLLRRIFVPERYTHAMPGYKTYRLESGQRYRLSSAI